MKFKFKPQTGLLAGGLVAATYVSACYYAQTATTTYCFYAGATVDHIDWRQNVGSKEIKATADWNQGKQNGSTGYLISVVDLAGTDSRYDRTVNGQYFPDYCYGPAKFLDPASQYQTVSYWENGLLDYSTGVPPNPAGGGSWGVPSGATCP